MTVIIDYGVGNLFSLSSSLAAVGVKAKVTGDADEILAAERVILPGVGAFADAMHKLEVGGLAAVVRKTAGAGTPLLGICLGMQLLFEESDEFGRHPGLGLIEGRVCSLHDALAKEGFSYKIPHMGWNPLKIARPESPIVKYSAQGDAMYYVHSYYAKTPAKYIVATSEYGIPVTGIVQNGNVFGTQFHPEKSGEKGLAVLRAFAEV